MDKKTYNQKYCSQEHCRKATNQNIMKKYYKNRDRKKGKRRYCECGSILSRYNETDICASCNTKKELERNQEVRKMFQSVLS